MIPKNKIWSSFGGTHCLLRLSLKIGRGFNMICQCGGGGLPCLLEKQQSTAFSHLCFPYLVWKTRRDLKSFAFFLAWTLFWGGSKIATAVPSIIYSSLLLHTYCIIPNPIRMCHYYIHTYLTRFFIGVTLIVCVCFEIPLVSLAS